MATTPDNIPKIIGSPDGQAPRQESLIEYPSQFPIKVLGLKVDGLVSAITHVAHQFDPTIDASTIELRERNGGKYLGVTVTVKLLSGRGSDGDGDA